MKKYLVKKGVVVVRDGKRVRPQIGKSFSFDEAEAADINAATPGSLALASEVEIEDGDDSAVDAAVASSAEASQAGAKGGKKRPTANKSDKEAAGKTAEKTGDGDDDL
jgi:hypothetical protein